jgi:transposase
MSFQGTAFTPEMRKLVVNVKTFFSQNKRNPSIFTEQSAFTLTAKAMGIGEATVRNIIMNFNKGGESALSLNNVDNRGSSSFLIEAYSEAAVEAAVRSFVRVANKEGKQVTIEIIKQFVLNEFNINIAHTTLWRALYRWGFEFGKGIRSAQLKESQRVIINRRKYLRAKLANRRSDGSTIRPEVYLDESYINKNHSKDSTWFGEEDRIIGKPTGKGSRLIILNAITKDGWVPNAKLVFQSSKKTGDYHSSMNWDVFSKWFKDQLLPNIPDKSIIILDNAVYHNVLAEEAFPKPTHTVQRLQDWLRHNNIPWTTDMVKAELFELCKQHATKPEYALDKIVADQGHSILRTPPYHPELQPIETCWAVVKGHVAFHNNFKMETVWQLLEEGFNKVTAHTINGIIKRVGVIEDDFWIEDAKAELQEVIQDVDAQEDDFEEDEELA